MVEYYTQESLLTLFYNDSQDSYDMDFQLRVKQLIVVKFTVTKKMLVYYKFW